MKLINKLTISQIEKKAIYFIAIFISSCFLTFLSTLIYYKLSIINIFISFSSSFIFLISIYNFLIDRDLKSHTLFFFIFFLGLYINTFMLSIYQLEKTIEDIYYLIFGPFLFGLLLYFFETKKIKTYFKCTPLINIDLVYLLFLLSYISIKVYIGMTLGWRISYLLASTYLIDGGNFTMPGYSGLAAILQWLLLIFSSYTKKRYVVLAVIAILVFSILHVKRGDIMRMLFFLILQTIANFKEIKKYNLKRAKKIKKWVISIIIISVIVFIYAGNLREEAKGAGTVDSLSQNIGIKDASPFLIWFYGYLPINYDVVRYYYNISHSYEPTALSYLFMPEQEEDYTYSINGFNASTFLRTFIIDYGEFYFIELLILSLIIGVIIILCRKEKNKGTYTFVLLIISFFFFGNYFESRSIFFPILLSLIIFPFLKIKNNKSSNVTN